MAVVAVWGEPSGYREALKEAFYYLGEFPRIKRKLEERRAEIEERARQEAFVLAAGDRLPGDPTGKKVLELARLHRGEAWVKIIEIDFLPTLTPEERRLVELRWQYGRGVRGRPVWTVTAQELHYSEGPVKQLWHGLCQRLAWHAARAGLFTNGLA